MMITNFKTLKSAGIFADRTRQSPALNLRRFNLVYGFNGCGKSTLSRLLASLETGELHDKLPIGCTFEVELEDGTSHGFPTNPKGLERRVVVFNSDYVEKNLRWTDGVANPVFFIGADQADAAAELEAVERAIPQETAMKNQADESQKSLNRLFAIFKRDRAKITAASLHLGNRKYEAPALAKDYDEWKEQGATTLSAEELKSAEETRRAAEPLPPLDLLSFDTEGLPKAFEFIADICAQSVTVAALSELEKHPEMLMWLKEGHEFHEKHELENCLFCGNHLPVERRAALAAAFDNTIDLFVARLAQTEVRLQSLVSGLQTFQETIPGGDSVGLELRPDLAESRANLVRLARDFQAKLNVLSGVLSAKMARPASPVDTSAIEPMANVQEATASLLRAIEAVNAVIGKHNSIVGNFEKHREDAELAIRQHFLADCRTDFDRYLADIEKADTDLAAALERLAQLETRSKELQQAIRKHGPAASAINQLVASYLGHNELTIVPVEQGYELHRHGNQIHGLPSEGEKTAIAISYFLSSIEADGKKLKDMIVIIDDPVSSLDTKALNYACALLRGRLESAAQVIILTHNLQCMNEFKKGWRTKARPVDKDKEPTATFLFIDVSIPAGQDRRVSHFGEMSRLLREYDSEYHYLFSHVLRFTDDPDAYYDHGYMMPNVLRRVLDVFLAFKCPGSSGLVGLLSQLCGDYPGLDKDRLAALERLSQVESHSDNLDDLLSFSSMTLEETKQAAQTLIAMIEHVDSKHLAGVKRLCR